jgi:hypothetical protein
LGTFQRKIVSKNAAAIARLAKVDFDGGISCLIISLSETKATIEAAFPLNLPIEFKIEIDGESKKRHCAVAWRRNRRVGVYFV